MPRILRALRHPTFRVIWLCFVIGQGGFWLSQVTVQVLVVTLSGGDPLRQGVLVLIFFAPQLVVSPATGVLADRYDRARLMAAGQAAMALVAALLAVMTYTGRVGLPALYVLSAGLGAAFALLGPTGLALVGQAVPVQDIASAVALQSVAQNLARVAGPALAVPVVFLGGPGAAFAGFALLASLAVLLLMSVSLPDRPRAPRIGFFANLAGGLAHARSRPPTLLMLSMILVAGFLSGPYASVLGPVLTITVLHGGANAYFVLVVAVGVGAAVGALATGFQLGPPRTILVAADMGLLGLTLIGVGLVSSYGALLLVSALYGAAFFALTAMVAASIQYLVAESSRGRVMSLYATAWGGALPPGALVLGYLAHTLGTRPALLMAGGALAAYALAVVCGQVVVGRRRLAGAESEPAG